jgi:uncharacterized protein with NRDE domain
MCTIIVLRGIRSDFPLVLATNRDEFYARKTSAPARILEQPSTVGGRDLEAGGTWMGVTAAGLFVGVTNHRTFGPADRSKRSRGELVLRALASADVDSIRGFLAREDGRDYNAFNLLFGDARTLYAAYGRTGQRDIELEAVPEGIHVLPNGRLDAPDFIKVARARELLVDHARAPWAELRARLIGTLSDGVMPAFESIPEPPAGSMLDRPLLARLAALCVRTPAYGTRSSTIVAITPRGVGEYLYADGPPDATEFVDVKGLF